MPFRILKQFNRPSGAPGYRGRIDALHAEHFPGDGLVHRFVRALGERRAVPFKEVLESFEFFQAVRKDVRHEAMADLCSGHGLVGALFALFEERVERVVMIDRKPPPSRDLVLAAAQEVGPWVEGKVRFADGPLKKRAGEIEEGSSVVAVHACGLRTDECLELAVERGGRVAVMPCCRPHGRSPAPGAVARAVGGDLAFDIDRTYRLEQAGYRVRWTDIPESITPMNRVLIGRLRSV